MKRLILGLSLLVCPLTLNSVSAQDVTLAFDLSSEGQRFSPTWGLDQAWISEQNMRKGINHMGKENVGIGRSCFRNTQALINDSALAGDQISHLRRRANILKLAGDHLPVVLTADQEAEGGPDPYFVVNKSANVDHWAAGINSHVHWMQENTTLPVVGISPFNEPDYWTVEEGATIQKHMQVAKILKEQYPRMDTIAMVGANTLNDDKALEWYNGGKQYYDWGNTHQLAGSFDNFAKFYQQMVADGKVGYADEMHNVGEAMIAMEYGATIGIWWGFDSRARGEFCDISRHGRRLAYGEHRTNWTAASVWQHDDGRAKAFIGSSERQAATTDYQFVSLDRDVYFDGHGPLRQFNMQIPGGAVGSYQQGQTNAERVIDIVWGEDVPPTAIAEGTYKLVNKGNGNVAAVSGNNIVTTKYTGAKTQQWNVAPSIARIGGDFSFYDFRNANNGKTCMDVENYSCLTNANVIAYTPSNNPTSNQQWYLQYAGNGYYYVRNRESALYLSAFSNKTTNGINVCQRTLQTDSTLHACQLWRLLPTDVDYETEAPSQPTGLLAELRPSSICLQWNKGEEADLDGYMVLRYEENLGWNTIARGVLPPYTDNTALPGHTYQYKVKAIDQAQNLSLPSDVLEASVTGWKDVVAQWPLNGTLHDTTENQRHATAAVGEAEYEEDADRGTVLNFRKEQYLQLPSSLVQGDELTVSMMVKSMSTKTNQRLFDFGHDADHYVSLIPYNANSRLRLSIKNGGDEQVLDCPTRLQLLRWKHIVVTMKPGHAAIYVDGELVAESDAISISPADVVPVVNYMGRSQAKGYQPLSALMSDVRIYNYALSPEETAQLYATVSGIADQTTSPSTTAAPAIYSPAGILLQQPQRGLNIIDGKKVVR